MLQSNVSHTMQLDVFVREIDVDFRVPVDLFSRRNANKREHHRAFL
jgi:hypothetical protein